MIIHKRCDMMRIAHSFRVCLPCRQPLKPTFARSEPQKSLLQQRPRLLPLRHLTYTNRLRQKDNSRQQNVQGEVLLRAEQSESIKPESFQKPSKPKPAEAPKTDALLAEQTVSNKEQRKADWAIIKEMAKYIWPKVWLASTNKFREGPNDALRTTSEHELE